MTLQVDLFWSFRSPYSYLVLPRVKNLVQEYDVDVRARPVYPLAVRDPSILKKMHPLFLNYFLLDTKRLAEFHGMPFAQPDPDPVDFAAAMVDNPEQPPLIMLLMRLAAAAAERGRCLEFVDEMSRMIFGGVQDWDSDDAMNAAIRRAGLEPGELRSAAASDAAQLDAWVEKNHEDQAAAGHWGVPLLVHDGEPFFGQDRFELLVWRLQQNGLEKR